MIARTGPFPREERIRRSREFQSVSRRGQRQVSSAFVVVTAPRAAGSAEATRSRLGLTVSRRVGGSVVRNRVKRRIREWFRQEGRSRAVGRDVVVIARSDAALLPSGGTARQLNQLLGPST